MNLQRKYFFILLFSFLITSLKIFSQPKYDFDFKSGWGWENLTSRAVLEDPMLIPVVEELKEELTIEEARIIFYQLSRLNSLKDISRIDEVYLLDTKEQIERFESIYKIILNDVKEVKDNFHGILNFVVKLAEIRKKNNENLTLFKNREYLFQPVDTPRCNVKINFDYTSAQKVLDYFDKSSTDKIKEILPLQPYQIILGEKGLNEISSEVLISSLKNSIEENPLFFIYKWLNTQAFWDFGTVSLYKNNFEKVIQSLNENESNINLDILKRLCHYLPDNTSFDINVFFLFGQRGPSWLTEDKRLGIDMEYFGDDYDYIVRLIVHNSFLLAQKEIQLPVYEFALSGKDRTLLEIMTDVLTIGTANYVGPKGTETRPAALLEKDFGIFDVAFRDIYNPFSKKKTKKTIALGYEGIGPFYTMGTQMAYIIENVLGKKALTESIARGPVAFFSKYIEAYEQSTNKKIRTVFRFENYIEDKIHQLENSFPQNVVGDFIQLKNYTDSLNVLSEKIENLNVKHSGFKNLPSLLSAQLFLETGQFEKAKEYFLEGIKNNPDKGIIASEIGDLFFDKGANSIALEFYNLGVESSPTQFKTYKERGEYFYKTGNSDRANEDFKKAYDLEPDDKEVDLYLRKLNE